MPENWNYCDSSREIERERVSSAAGRARRLPSVLQEKVAKRARLLNGFSMDSQWEPSKAIESQLTLRQRGTLSARKVLRRYTRSDTACIARMAHSIAR